MKEDGGAAQHAGAGTVLRAAGDWVRDKLIGRESPDIDIALDNMLGADFAEKVCLFVVVRAALRRAALAWRRFACARVCFLARRAARRRAAFCKLVLLSSGWSHTHKPRNSTKPHDHHH